jgi:hypothetical protein
MNGKNESKKIFINLEERFGDRYLFQILRLFDSSGYSIHLYTKKPPSSFCRYEYGRLIYNIRNLSFVSKIPSEKRKHILCTDNINFKNGEGVWRKRIKISHDISLNRRDHEGALIIPYGMHPGIYEQNGHKKLESLRKNSKKIRILFSGRYGTNYDHSILQKQFGKLSRPQIIKLIKKRALSKIICSRAEFDKLFKNDYQCIFAFVDTKHTDVDQRKWMVALSRSDFFLAAPGDVRPMCHNIIEAMAVGTIPIMNYPEWFHPPLTKMKNCITFTNEVDFIAKVGVALSMDDRQIEEMKNEVVNYYDRFIEESAFIARLENVMDNEVELFFQSGIRKYLAKIDDDSIIVCSNNSVKPICHGV